MKKSRWKKIVAGALVAVLLAGSLPDYKTNAREVSSGDMDNAGLEVSSGNMDNAEPEVSSGDMDHTGLEVFPSDMESAGQEVSSGDMDNTGLEVVPGDLDNVGLEVPPEDMDNGGEELPPENQEEPVPGVPNTGDGQDVPKNAFQYVFFQDHDENVRITVLNTQGVSLVEREDVVGIYKIDTAVVQEFRFNATVDHKYKLIIPEALSEMLVLKQSRSYVDGKWLYQYGLQTSAFFSTEQTPLAIRLTLVNDDADPTAVQGVNIKLVNLTSSAQGYSEIVLNFTADSKVSDGTETEDIYYEVRVAATPKNGEEIPAGSTRSDRYFYIPKIPGSNTQSKAVKVNFGDLSAPTACTYAFSVRLVMIDKRQAVPEENVPLEEPLVVVRMGNAITRSYATKNLYIEDKLGFTKKCTKIYTGQEDMLVGTVKYSKKASYIHDLMAVAYDSRGGVCEGLTCTFKNDNDELYMSADWETVPGQYKVVVYAGIGEAIESSQPQDGTMYQANATFTVTVLEGIYSIDTSKITKQAAVNTKNITFSAVPVGYGYNTGKKAKTQKFTYEIKSAIPDGSGNGYIVTEPVEKVKNNVSVNKNGKVTVKRKYYVDPDASKNYIAIVIKAADYAGNKAVATAYVRLVDVTLIPKKIYLLNSQGKVLGNKVTIDKANGAYILVEDQFGNNMNQYVTITPVDNEKKNASAYVTPYGAGDPAVLSVRRISNITIKATTKDGGKKSKSLKVTIEPPNFTQASYYIESITSNGMYYNDIDRGTGLVTYSAPKGAVIRMQQGARINGVRYFNKEWFDWKYQVKDGKLEVDGKYWLLTPTAKTMELTVWLKSDSTRSWTVKFTNRNWKTNYISAPEVKQISGKLYSNKYTRSRDLLRDEETGKIQVPDQYLLCEYEYGSYDNIQVGKVSKEAPELFISDFNPEYRTFRLNLKAGNDIKAGSFEYRIAFYKNGELMSTPAPMTVRIHEAQPVKFEQNYMLNLSRGDTVLLKKTPVEFMPDLAPGLMNANEGGKASKFTTYFELAVYSDPVSGQEKAVVQFKPDVTREQKEQLKGKTLSGYVKYSYHFGYSYIRNATSKITITVK